MSDGPLITFFDQQGRGPGRGTWTMDQVTLPANVLGFARVIVQRDYFVEQGSDAGTTINGDATHRRWIWRGWGPNSRRLLREEISTGIWRR